MRRATDGDCGIDVDNILIHNPRLAKVDSHGRNANPALPYNRGLSDLALQV